MNSKERILKAMSGEETDYVPCSPFFNNQDYVQRIGKKWEVPFGPSQEERLHYYAEVLGIDPVVTVPWNQFEADETVTARVWIENGIIRKEYDTPAGKVSAAVRYSSQWPHGLDIPFYSDYNIAHFTEPWLTSREDLECLRFVFRAPHSDRRMEKIRFDFREAERLAEQYQAPIMVSAGEGLTGAVHLCGAEQVCMMTVEQPGLLKDFLALEHQVTMENCRIAAGLGMDILRRNGFYESGDFFSPRLLEDMIGHHLKELADLTHQFGKKIGYTTLTRMEKLTGYLSASGIDALLCPDPFFRGADPGKLVEGMGGSTCFWTGPSDTVHMPWADTEKVREAVRETFRIFGKKGLIITPCSSAKAVFPWENFTAMVDEWKKLR